MKQITMNILLGANLILAALTVHFVARPLYMGGYARDESWSSEKYLDIVGDDQWLAFLLSLILVLIAVILLVKCNRRSGKRQAVVHKAEAKNE